MIDRYACRPTYRPTNIELTCTVVLNAYKSYLQSWKHVFYHSKLLEAKENALVGIAKCHIFLRFSEIPRIATD